MGFRFRKSIKIAPGVRFNINKKSIGISAGVKGARVSVNSSGRKTTTVGIPGTGLSYSSTNSITKKKKGGFFSNLFFRKSKYADLIPILFNAPEDSKISEKQIIAAIPSFFAGKVKIVEDCTKLVNETKKADIFFSRFDLLLSTLTELSKLELHPGFFKSELPSEAMKRIEENTSATQKDFINRTWAKLQEKVNSLKTEKAKKNNIEKWYLEMELYIEQFTDESKEYVKSLYKDAIGQAN